MEETEQSESVFKQTMSMLQPYNISSRIRSSADASRLKARYVLPDNDAYQIGIFIILFTVVAYIFRLITNVMPSAELGGGIKKFVMVGGRIWMMILMAIPEQIVMYLYEGHHMAFFPDRISVSFAMYAIHFAYNGFVMKPEKSYNELVWIIGTALYAYFGVQAQTETVTALLAADSIMALLLRGL